MPLCHRPQPQLRRHHRNRFPRVDHPPRGRPPRAHHAPKDSDDGRAQPASRLRAGRIPARPARRDHQLRRPHLQRQHRGGRDRQRQRVHREAVEGQQHDSLSGPGRARHCTLLDNLSGSLWNQSASLRNSRSIVQLSVMGRQVYSRRGAHHLRRDCAQRRHAIRSGACWRRYSRMPWAALSARTPRRT